jgi:hypothetical protein
VEKKVVRKVLLWNRGINTKMDSTVMQYDQQHEVDGSMNLKKKMGFTHLRERDNTYLP